MGSWSQESGFELDRTLKDLYLEDNDTGEIPSLAFILQAGPQSLSEGLPVSTKYAYQAPKAPKLATDVMARVCLCTGPQKMSFVAGNMKINLINPDKHKNEPKGNAEYRSHQLDAINNFSHLPEHQRPQIDFVYHPDEIEPEGHKIADLTPLDCFDNLPMHCDPDIHYELLSKRELAICDLPTPESTLIDCELSADDVEDDTKVAAETDRFMNYIKEAVAPFVVKFPQAMGGRGVFIVKNDAEKTQVIKDLYPEIPKMIKQINHENEHLHVACLIIQAMIPGTAVAHSFFITKGGRAIFTGCVEQDISPEGAWSGATINYLEQKALEEQYGETMQKIATHVRNRGYWGPMGADIMTDIDGKQQVIDLNVRVAGSYTLGFVKNHFSVKRGFNYASLLYPLPLKGDRAGFEKTFAEELAAGKLLISGWTHGRAGPWGIVKYSVAAVLVAGATPEDLRALVDKVNARRLNY